MAPVSQPTAKGCAAPTGQRDAERRAFGAAALQHQRAVMGFGDPTRDRQSKTCALTSARRIELDESIEDALLILSGYSGTGVADAEGDVVGVAAQVDGDGAAGRGVLHGILQDVQDQLSQQVLVAAVGKLGRTLQQDLDTALRRKDIDRAAAVGDQFIEIEIDRPQRIPARIRAREHQQIVHEAAQPPGLTADSRQRLAVFGLVTVLAIERHPRSRGRSTPACAARARRRP